MDLQKELTNYLLSPVGVRLNAKLLKHLTDDTHEMEEHEYSNDSVVTVITRWATLVTKAIDAKWRWYLIAHYLFELMTNQRIAESLTVGYKQISEFVAAISKLSASRSTRTRAFFDDTHKDIIATAKEMYPPKEEPLSLGDCITIVGSGNITISDARGSIVM